MSSFRNTFQKQQSQKYQNLQYDNLAFLYYSSAILSISILILFIILLKNIFFNKRINLIRRLTKNQLYSKKANQEYRQIFANYWRSRNFILLILSFVICITLNYILLKQISQSNSNLKRFDPYELLNVDIHSSIDQIKKSYRKLALKFHPDKNPNNPEASIQFSLISKAYECLAGNEKTRQLCKKFGNAQGSQQSVEIGIALPQFILYPEYNLKVFIVIFSILLIVIPKLYFKWNKNLQKKDERGILISNYSTLYKYLKKGKRSISENILMLMFCGMKQVRRNNLAGKYDYIKVKRRIDPEYFDNIINDEQENENILQENLGQCQIKIEQKRQQQQRKQENEQQKLEQQKISPNLIQFEQDQQESTENQKFSDQLSLRKKHHYKFKKIKVQKFITKNIQDLVKYFTNVNIPNHNKTKHKKQYPSIVLKMPNILRQAILFSLDFSTKSKKKRMSLIINNKQKIIPFYGCKLIHRIIKWGQMFYQAVPFNKNSLTHKGIVTSLSLTNQQIQKLKNKKVTIQQLIKNEQQIDEFLKQIQVLRRNYIYKQIKALPNLEMNLQILLEGNQVTQILNTDIITILINIQNLRSGQQIAYLKNYPFLKNQIFYLTIQVQNKLVYFEQIILQNSKNNKILIECSYRHKKVKSTLKKANSNIINSQEIITLKARLRSDCYIGLDIQKKIDLKVSQDNIKYERIVHKQDQNVQSMGKLFFEGLFRLDLEKDGEQDEMSQSGDRVNDIDEEEQSNDENEPSKKKLMQKQQS